MSYVRRRTAPIREKRLGTLSAWYGSAGSLVREAGSDGDGLVPRIRSFTQDAASDLILALELLSTWEDAVIVIHGPAGCAAGLRSGREARAPWLVTNIGERDSILGGDAKLRSAIIEAYRRHAPKAVFVVSSPVVVINNDDIDSTTEAAREELGIPVVPVYVDGFRSKIAATGFDAVAHGLLKHLAPKSGKSGGPGAHIGLLSLSESREDVAGLRALLAEAGIEALPFPRFCHPDEMLRVFAARLSVALNAAEAHYTGEALQADHAVPCLRPPAPVGIDGTARWLAAVGEALGKSEDVARLVARETRRLEQSLANGAALRGRRIFIHLSPDHAFAFARLAGELGLEVAGVKVPYLDPVHVDQLKALAARNEALPILVGEGQPFEEIGLLRSSRPDLYLGRGCALTHAVRLGIAVLDAGGLACLGFAGVANLLEQIERRLSNTAFQDFLAEGEADPYTQGWRQKSAYWYIKHEVR
jgi:nitrogenase molybdenum-iron protein alpha/beta subunit